MTPEPALEITRVFDAARERVFAAWVDLDQLKKWSGPDGFEVRVVEGEARPGGAWRMCMSSPEYGELWSHGLWREIDPPRRLAFTTAWETSDGTAEHEMLVTVTFTDLGGRTEMHFHQAPFRSVESRDGHKEGWSECFDTLATVLAAT